MIHYTSNTPWGGEFSTPCGNYETLPEAMVAAVERGRHSEQLLFTSDEGFHHLETPPVGVFPLIPAGGGQRDRTCFVATPKEVIHFLRKYYHDLL